MEIRFLVEVSEHLYTSAWLRIHINTVICSATGGPMCILLVEEMKRIGIGSRHCEDCLHRASPARISRKGLQFRSRPWAGSLVHSCSAMPSRKSREGT